MAQPTRAAYISDSSIAMEHGGAITSINLNAEAEKAGPIGRTRALDGADVIPGKTLLVLDAGVNLDITRQSQGPINLIASGISHYIICNFLSITSRLEQID